MEKYQVKMDAGKYSTYASGRITAEGRVAFTEVDARKKNFDTAEEAQAFIDANAAKGFPGWTPSVETVEVEV